MRPALAAAAALLVTPAGALLTPASAQALGPIGGGPIGGPIEVDTYIFSIAISGNGTVRGDLFSGALGAQTFSCSASCTRQSILESTYDFTATPDTGWGFLRWTDPGDAVQPLRRTSTTTGTTISAEFVNRPPIAQLAAPPSGALVRGTVPLTVTGSDVLPLAGEATGIAQTNLRINAADGTERLAQQSAGPAPLVAAWDTTTVPDGDYVVGYGATDIGGSGTLTLPHRLTVDNTPPQLTVTGPDGDAFTTGTTQTWRLASSDANPTDPVIRLCAIDDAPPTPCPAGDRFETTPLPAGDHTARFAVLDRAGNRTEVVRTFTIDGTPPSTTISDTRELPGGGRRWELTANEPGVRFECRVSLAALTPGPFSACSETAAHTATDFPPGTYAFEARAIDRAGNVEPVPPRRVFSIAAPPTPVPLAERVVAMNFKYAFKGRAGRATLTRLQLRNVTPGAALAARCKGGGCPKRVTIKVTKGGFAVGLTGRSLRAGTTITITATKPGLTSRIVTLTVGRDGRVSDRVRCLAPGAKRAAACPA